MLSSNGVVRITAISEASSTAILPCFPRNRKIPLWKLHQVARIHPFLFIWSRAKFCLRSPRRRGGRVDDVTYFDKCYLSFPLIEFYVDEFWNLLYLKKVYLKAILNLFFYFNFQEMPRNYFPLDPSMAIIMLSIDNVYIKVDWKLFWMISFYSLQCSQSYSSWDALWALIVNRSLMLSFIVGARSTCKLCHSRW